MKKTIKLCKNCLGALFILSLSFTQAHAGNGCTVTLPSECLEVVDSRFNTHEGINYRWWVMQVSCKIEAEPGYKVFFAARPERFTKRVYLLEHLNIPKDTKFSIADPKDNVKEADYSCD